MDLRALHGPGHDGWDVPAQAGLQAGLQRHVSHGAYLRLQGSFGYSVVWVWGSGEGEGEGLWFVLLTAVVVFSLLWWCAVFYVVFLLLFLSCVWRVLGAIRGI